MAIDQAALVVRAAELLTDEEYDFWLAGFHERSVSEALCLITELGDQDDLMTCVSVTTTAGALQVLPDGYDRFVKVVSNTGGRSVRQYDRAKLDNLIPCWADQVDKWRGYVEFFTEGCGDKGSFSVYPPAPAGHELTVSAVKDSGSITLDELGCKYQSAIIDYMLWRAFEREGSENINKWQGYRASFWDTLGVFKAADIEREMRARGYQQQGQAA